MTDERSAGRPVSDRRVNVVQAAEILGITPDAVRSRLRRGTLLRDRGSDGEVLVVLPGDPSHGQSGDQSRPSPTVALVEALENQIEQLSRQLDEANRANAEHRRLLAAALERIPAIEAPEPREAPVTGTEGETGTGTGASDANEDTGQERAPWWRRWFGF